MAAKERQEFIIALCQEAGDTGSPDVLGLPINAWSPLIQARLGAVCTDCHACCSYLALGEKCWVRGGRTLVKGPRQVPIAPSLWFKPRAAHTRSARF